MVIELRKHNLFLKTSKIIQHNTSSWQEKDYKTRRHKTAKLSWRFKHSNFPISKVQDEKKNNLKTKQAEWWVPTDERRETKSMYG